MPSPFCLFDEFWVHFLEFFGFTVMALLRLSTVFRLRPLHEDGSLHELFLRQQLREIASLPAYSLLALLYPQSKVFPVRL